MSSVVERINRIKQPRGGYIKPSEFDVEFLDDGTTLNDEENIHGSVIGMVVDYLTRFSMGAKITDAFKPSLQGAVMANELGFKNAYNIGKSLILSIRGLDEESIVNACKLVSFDVWYRSPLIAMSAKTYQEINPDKETIENIQTLVKRSISFFEKYGPVTKDGFTFEPPNPKPKEYEKMLKKGKGNYGGYTPTVDSGDGDFLTENTLWDFKVSKSKPTNKNTLQLLMYWLMGQHSGQDIFKKITKIGIFNPRLNAVYTLEISKIQNEIIKLVEDEIIGY